MTFKIFIYLATLGLLQHVGSLVVPCEHLVEECGISSQNLVLQQLPAIIFGAPLLLMVGFAGQNLTNTLIVFGVVIVMFIVYNIILLRKYIFKKKNK